MIFKHVVKGFAEMVRLLAALSALYINVKVYTTCLVQHDCISQGCDRVWNTSSADKTYQGSLMAKLRFSSLSQLWGGWVLLYDSCVQTNYPGF